MANKTSIIVAPDPVLRKTSVVVDNPAEHEELIRSMVLTMRATKSGVGLSAIQVGQALQIFIMEGENPNTLEVVCNPVIVDFGSTKEDLVEGCLSFPNVFERVSRSKQITADYRKVNLGDFTWEDVKGVSFSGLQAQVFQHETEHMAGKLLVDHVPNHAKRILNRLSKWKEKGYIYP